ncbi:hypothetical protein F4775DRAFT_390860 [Biscogniauxia sp. FL1348]|nr:hypothetical protein F4775DRAFT_390860 [Biscogniauxia sp. FL1348]
MSDYLFDEPEGFSLFGSPEQELAQPTTSVYPDPEPAQSNAYASPYVQGQVQPTSLPNPQGLTFPRPQASLTFPTVEGSSHSTNDNATTYGPVSGGNDVNVDVTSGQYQYGSAYELTTEGHGASINEPGLEQPIDAGNYAAIGQPNSQGGNPTVTSAPAPAGNPIAAIDDFLRQMYADELRQAEDFFSGMQNCPICGQHKKQMFRHVASHVTFCQMGRCNIRFSSSRACGRHFLEHPDHNGDATALNRCCFGCNIFPQTRTYELSTHMRKHMLAYLIARGRLDELR